MSKEFLDQLIQNLLRRERRALANRWFALATFYERVRFHFTRLRVQQDTR